MIITQAISPNNVSWDVSFFMAVEILNLQNYSQACFFSYRTCRTLMSVSQSHKCKLNFHEIAKRICTSHIIHFVSHTETEHNEFVTTYAGLRHKQTDDGERENNNFNAGEKRNLM